MQVFRSRLESANSTDILKVTVKCRNVYEDILPVKVYRTKRLRRVVKRGWTDNLSAIVWEKLRLPCCLRWKVANVRRDDIYCEGSCIGCELVITCVAMKNKLKFTIRNYDAGVPHNPKQKRRMNAAATEKVRVMLKGKSAFDVHLEMTDQLTKPGDPSCSILPTNKAIRRINDKVSSSKLPTIDALLALKKQHPNAIGSIGLDPFHLFYSTDLQKAYFKEACREKKRIVLCIDATGIGAFSDN